MDKVRARHKCLEMPKDEFMEIQNTYWHIHKKHLSHTDYRKEVKDGVCPYCHKDLINTQVCNIKEDK